ncbi:carbohydate-binding domain-containing protein [Catenovulum sp. SM1970]|uniref:family 20 glycosylhydrolase n=1 Tax=Marinifaba aquimaris TaxID=2741323 RepID=UPI0015741E4C|nr:carbohydate-binding domain-containing protein [Marinifaba aquimaris]
MGFKKLLLASCISAVASFGASAKLTQQDLSAFTKDTTWKVGVVDNFVDGAKSHIGVIKINNASDIELPAGKGDWAFYFHSIRLVEDLYTKVGLTVEHVQGDLHRLVPTDEFKGLKAGQELEIKYQGQVWAVSKSDFMPRAFFYHKGLEPSIFANTDTEDFNQFVLPITKPEQLKRYNDPVDRWETPTAASRYQDNKSANAKADELDKIKRQILPTPVEAKISSSTTTLDKSWSIEYQGRTKSEAGYLVKELEKLLATELDKTAVKKPTKNDKVISLRVNEKLAGGNAESYELEIEDDRIEIVGSDEAGVFYGIQSALSLIKDKSAGKVKLYRGEVEDSPRFHFRGMHYDIGRNFHGKEALFKFVDALAMYKLNKLHLHLTEDEGWRLEIPGLPELTEIAGNRCFDLEENKCLLTQLGSGPFDSGSGNGFLKTEEFVELLKYAKERHVEIIPEIESPGHARSQIIAMEVRHDRLMAEGKPEAAKEFLLSDPEDKSEYLTVQLYTDNAMNVCMPSALKFMDKVAYELQQMYRQAGLKLNTLHVGGDEVGHGAWTKSPACEALFADPTNGISGVADLKQYFVKGLADMTAKRGLAIAAWEDGLMFDPQNPFIRDQIPNPNFYSNVWDNIWEWGVADRAYRLANEDFKVVLSHGTHLYFDHPYEAHPDERGYYWAARYTPTEKTFGYMPDDFYANADFTRAGDAITDLEDTVGRALPQLEKPENILGMQGHVWTETIRTAEQMFEMVFPRALAVAERAWHKAEWEGVKVDKKARAQDWADFSASLAGKELERLTGLGINYHLPVPGGVIESGQLKANAAFPGIKIEYSTDGSTWSEYTKPVKVNVSEVQLRTVGVNGDFSRVSVAK